MTLHGTENHHQYLDDQTATSRDCHSGNKPPLHSASDPAASDAYLLAEHLVAAEKIRDESANAKVRQIYMRDAGLRRRDRLHPSSSVADAALHRLTHHIGKSIPGGLRTSPAILPRFWFAAHNKVAVFALHQVHRKVHQLGLIRVADTTGFLVEHCRWYVWFCSFSQFVTSNLFQPHKELI